MITLVVVCVAIATVAHASLQCPLIDNGDDSLTINLTSVQPKLINRTLFETVYDCKPYVENVTHIIMSNNEITNIDQDTFGIFYNLIHLNLSHNNISELHVDTFNRLRKLQELDLSFNLLNELEAGLIRILSLVSVWFNNNNISYVEPGIVSSDNEALLYFNMDNNSLTYLDPWPYLTYQTNAHYVDREFYVRHNKISHFSNNLNWTYDIEYPYQVYIHAENNELQGISNSDVQQYDKSLSFESAFSVFLTLRMNITNNPYFCDCNVYSFAQYLRAGILRYSRVEEFRYICNSPSKVAGIDWLHDVDLSELVCNMTDSCPSNCFCQDRPHNDTFLVDCNGAGLTEMPDVIPENNRSRIELLLDNNYITELKNVSFINRVYNISLRYNSITTLDGNILEHLDAAKLDLSYNKIRSLPTEIKKYNYDTVSLHGNPLWCDCDSLWLKDWLTVGNDVDTSLSCDSEEGTQIIAEMTIDDLGCVNDDLIIGLAIGGALLGLIVVGLIFAVRCPYETRVVLNMFTCGLIHPRDKYKITDENNKKEVDIYMVYDDQDEDVVGWVRYFLKKLNSKKLTYSILNPQRFMEPGSPAVTIPKWIGKSKRVIVVLSEGIFDNDHRNMEIDDAERRLVEAASRQNSTNIKVDERPNVEEMDEVRTDDSEINTREDDNNLVNAPKIIYIKFNASDLLKQHLNIEKWQLRLADNLDKGSEWQEKLNEEPWKSRMASKRVFSPDERLFWAKLRYELPAKGNGIKPDGNFVPPKPEDDNENVEQDTEHNDHHKVNDDQPNLHNVTYNIDNETTHGKGKKLKRNPGQGRKKIEPQSLNESLTRILTENPNQKTINVSKLDTSKAESSNRKVFNKLVGQTTQVNAGVGGQNSNINDRINFVSLGGNNPLADIASRFSKNLNKGANVPYSNNMNTGAKIGKNGMLSSNDQIDLRLGTPRCLSACSTISSLSSISKC